MQHHRLTSFFATLVAFSFSGALAGAQTTPVPIETMAPNPMASASPAPAATSAPAAAPSSAPTAAPAKSYKKLKSATLTTSQTAYALTHQLQEAKQLAKMKTINFDNIRLVKLSSTKLNILQRLHIRVDSGEQMIASEPFAVADAQTVIAQATAAPPTTNGNNSPLQFLHNVLANINVSNALNNLLNNSTVNANVNLSNVLNNNKIAIGQVVGIYVGGGGIINTIIK